MDYVGIGLGRLNKFAASLFMTADLKVLMMGESFPVHHELSSLFAAQIFSIIKTVATPFFDSKYDHALSL